jgi:Na+/H+ antiporter NhaD/arsenite permease-like protein
MLDPTSLLPLVALHDRAGAALAAFALAYVLIAARRFRFLPIGRPTGALLGAVLMVLLGVLAPREAYAAVDGDTIALLFGMMVLQVEFDRCGLLDELAARIAARAGSPVRLLAAVVVSSGVLSALLVNDAVCLLATPLVARLCRRARLPALPYLLALATGSNVGGTMTLTGTPQCMIIGSLSGISYARYAAVERETPLDVARAKRFGWTVLAVLAGFFAGLPIAWVALGGACLSALLRFGEPTENLARLDWALLLFFASLFVVIGGVARAGWVDLAADGLSTWLTRDPSARPWPFAAFSLVASNVLSNVPFVLVLGHGYPGAPDAFWFQLALTSTLAGNLTLVGSVANLIVAEAASREGADVGFLAYLKVGVPLTLVTTGAGLLLLRLFGYA